MGRTSTIGAEAGERRRRRTLTHHQPAPLQCPNIESPTTTASEEDGVPDPLPSDHITFPSAEEQKRAWRLLGEVSSSLAWLDRCLGAKLPDDLRARMILRRRDLRAQHDVRLWALTGAWLCEPLEGEERDESVRTPDGW